MPSVTRDEQIESLLAVAPTVAAGELVRLSDLERATGIQRYRISYLIGVLKEQGRWPYKMLKSSTKDDASKPKRERRPPVTDIEAYRAWAERERERLASG